MPLPMYDRTHDTMELALRFMQCGSRRGRTQASGDVVRVLRADEDVVNCIQVLQLHAQRALIALARTLTLPVRPTSHIGLTLQCGL